VNDLAYQYNDDMPTELLDGMVYAMSSPSVKHNSVAFNIATIFNNYLKGKPCKMIQVTSVKLTERDQPIPDVMIVCNRDIIKDDAVYGAPDLIVEILSPTTAKRDRAYKKNLYANFGVKEYWLVDTNNHAIEVYYNTDGDFILHDIYQIYPSNVISYMTDEQKAAIVHEFKTSLFDDLVIKIEDVFDDMI